MMTRRATPILASAAIALSVAACGMMGGQEQQTSERPTGSAGTSATSEQPTPSYQQYPPTGAQSESRRAPADYSSTTRRGASAEQTRSQQQSMAGAAGHDREAVQNIQQELERRGYELGQVDGIYGPRTQRAVTAFQRDENLRADGRIGPQTLAALGMDQSGQQVGEVPAATGTERPAETERQAEPAPAVTPEGTTPREQTGELPDTTAGTDLPQQPGTLPDSGSEAPGSMQPSERSGGIQGNEPSVETPMGGTPDTPR